MYNLIRKVFNRNAKQKCLKKTNNVDDFYECYYNGSKRYENLDKLREKRDQYKLELEERKNRELEEQDIPPGAVQPVQPQKPPKKLIPPNKVKPMWDSETRKQFDDVYEGREGGKKSRKSRRSKRSRKSRRSKRSRKTRRRSRKTRRR